MQEMSFPSCCFFADTGAEYKHLSVMLKHIFVEINAEFDVGMVLPESERFVPKKRIKLDKLFCVVFIFSHRTFQISPKVVFLNF